MHRLPGADPWWWHSPCKGWGMEAAIALIVLVVGITLERSRPADVRARIIRRR